MDMQPHGPSGFGQIHLGQPSGTPSAPPISGGDGSDKVLYKIEALERKLDAVLEEIQRLRREITTRG